MAFTFQAPSAATTSLFGTNPAASGTAAATTNSFSFGSTPNVAAPAANTTFNFGSTGNTASSTTAPVFGAPVAATTTTAPFSFGAPAAATTTTTTPFSFGAPAAATTTATPFSLGAPATTSASTTFSFGAPAASTAGAAPFSFGSSTINTAAANTAVRPTFAGLGTAPAAGSTFTGFGVSTASTGATTTLPAFNNTTFASQTQPFGAPAQLTALPGQIAPATVRPEDLLITSLTTPRLFHDERDELMLKWNILQVFYGTGKIFCHQGASDVDVNLPYHIFKTYSYSVRPRTRDEDGLVALIINQKLADVVKEKDKCLETLHRNCFSANPNCIIELEGISPLADDRTQMLIVISMKDPTTSIVKKIKASDVVNHLQPAQTQQTTSTLLAPPINPHKVHLDSLRIVQIFARTDLTEQDYKQYLDTVPPGLTAFIWEQAKKENPKPQLLLPVPLIGVKALRDRMKSQFIEYEDQIQQLETIRQQLRTVKDQCDTFRLTMKRYQTTLLEYSHRILKATIQFELRRRQHEPKLTPTEIQIWTNLQPIQNSIQPPLDIRVKDLIMKIRMNPTLLAPIQWSSIINSNDSLRFDKDKVEQIKDILQEIHRGIKNVVELVQNDRATLTKVEEKISQRK